MPDCLIFREVCQDAPARCWAPSCHLSRTSPNGSGTETNDGA